MLILTDGTKEVQGRKIVLTGNLALGEDANGLPQLSVTGVGTGNTSSAGTSGRLAKFTSATDLANALISDDGTNVSMLAPLILTTGSTGGVRFPNDAFGGSGDTAGIRYISRTSEDASLEIYVTNDSTDWVNFIVPGADNVKINGNTVWHAGNLTGVDASGNLVLTGYLDAAGGKIRVGAAGTAKILIDGTDGTVAASEVGIAESGGELTLSNRAGLTVMLDNANVTTTQRFRVRSNNTTTDVFYVQEDGTTGFNGDLLMGNATTKAAQLPGIYHVMDGNYAIARTSNSVGLLIQNTGMTSGLAGGGLHLAGGSFSNDGTIGGIWAGATSDLGTYTARYGTAASGVELRGGSILFKGNTGLTTSATFAPTTLATLSPTSFVVNVSTTLGGSFTNLNGPVTVSATNGSVGIRLGAVGGLNVGTFPDWGALLYFSGGPSGATFNTDNSDAIFMGRYNVASDQTELRVSIGDGSASNDRVVFGTGGTPAAFTEKAAIGADGQITSVSNITAAGDVIASTSNASGRYLIASAPAGQEKATRYSSAGSVRWAVGGSNGAESGSNVGTDFFINRYSDAGAVLSTPFSITRSSGLITVNNGMTTNGALTFGGGNTYTRMTIDIAANSKGRFAGDSNGGLQMATNASWDGSNWQRDDTTKGSYVYMQHLGNSRHEFRAAAAGTGVIAWSTPLSFDQGAVILAPATYCQSNFSALNGLVQFTDSTHGSMEIGSSTATSGTVQPYIDFHYAVGSAQDFNVRVINDAANTMHVTYTGGANAGLWANTGKLTTSWLGSTESGQTTGDLLYYDVSAPTVTDRFRRLPIGGAGYMLGSDGARPQWQPSITNIGSGDAKVAIVNTTTAAYIDTNPSLTAAPATPGPETLTPGYKCIIISFGSVPANIKMAAEYCTDWNGSTGSWAALPEFTGTQLVHSNLVIGTTYYYRVRQHGTSYGSYNSVQSAAPLSQANVSAFSLVTASQVATVNLAALSASLGVVGTGLIYNSLSSPTKAIRLSVVGGSDLTGITSYIDLSTSASYMLKFTNNSSADVLTLTPGGQLTMTGTLTTSNLIVPSGGVVSMSGNIDMLGTITATGLTQIVDSGNVNKRMVFQNGNLAVYNSVGGDATKQRALVGDYYVILGTTSSSTAAWSGTGTSQGGASEQTLVSSNLTITAVDNNSTIELPSANSQYTTSFTLTASASTSSGATVTRTTSNAIIEYQRWNGGVAVDASFVSVGAVANRTVYSNASGGTTASNGGSHTVTFYVPNTTYNEIRFRLRVESTVTGGISSGGSVVGTGSGALTSVTNVNWTGFAGTQQLRRGLAVPRDDGQPSLYLEPISSAPSDSAAAAGEIWVNDTKKRIEWHDGGGVGWLPRTVHYEMFSDYTIASSSVYNVITGLPGTNVKAGEQWIFEFEGITNLASNSQGLFVCLMSNTSGSWLDAPSNVLSSYRWWQMGQGGSGVFTQNTNTTGLPSALNFYTGTAYLKQKWTVTFSANCAVSFGAKGSSTGVSSVYSGSGYTATRVMN